MEAGDFGIALRALGTNRLRTGLTVAIIAVGIMSLVGIQTALAIMTEKVVGGYSKMGAGMLVISAEEGRAALGLREAQRFRNEARAALPAAAATVSIVRSQFAQAKYGSALTDPLVTMVEADENYLLCCGGEISEGRMFSEGEAESRSSVAVVGDNISRKLFPNEDPVGKTITVSGRHLQVVGRIARQGSMISTGLDNCIITPISGDGNFIVTLATGESAAVGEAAAAAKALMRAVRRLPASAPPDFVVTKADSLQDKLAAVKSRLSLAALVIGLITLLGSSVGLMNIMLVSVKERTREIGVRKALGARSTAISRQFLAEAVTIGQMGGAAGTILGILFGNLVALIMEGHFTILWDWVALSILICLAVSVLSGVVPARRAAALDPIAALRNA